MSFVKYFPIFLRYLYVRWTRSVALGFPVIFGEGCVLVAKGELRIGSRSVILRQANLESYSGSVLEIGNRCFINKNATFVARNRIKIGDDCRIGENVSIYDHDHDTSLIAASRRDVFHSKEVIIGNNVWIGRGVFIGKGVVIGDNAVIGANSIVTKSVPANHLYRIHIRPMLTPITKQPPAEAGGFAPGAEDWKSHPLRASRPDYHTSHSSGLRKVDCSCMAKVEPLEAGGFNSVMDFKY